MKKSELNINIEELEELGRAEQRKYKAEWRARNKEKVRESNRRYWIKRALANKEREGETDNAIK